MIRNWFLSFALWRANRLQDAAEYWTDIATWLRTGQPWLMIRARRTPRTNIGSR